MARSALVSGAPSVVTLTLSWLLVISVSVTHSCEVVICAETDPFHPELPFASASMIMISVSSILLHVYVVVPSQSVVVYPSSVDDDSTNSSGISRETSTQSSDHHIVE